MHFISLKIMASRVRDYLGYVQFPMVAYIFIVQTGFNLLQTVAVVIAGSLALAFVDWKVILPAEQKRTALKNPEWNRMMKKLDDIEILLKAFTGDK